ncbi:MAG TPA: DUF2341 domain-containing protein [bacterium]
MKRCANLSLLFSIGIICSTAHAQNWFDSAWAIRQPVTINNVTHNGDLTDYAVKVILTASAFDFAQALPHGEDLRFTDSDGLTALSYWIQAYDPAGASATIWVKVPQIAGGSVRSIYLYSGNPSALPASNGAQTFLMFSDFDSTFNVIAPAGLDTFTRVVYDPHFTQPVIPRGPAGSWYHWGIREAGNILVEPWDPNPNHVYKHYFGVLHDSLWNNDVDMRSLLAQSFSADGRTWSPPELIMDASQGGDTIYGDRPTVAFFNGLYHMHTEGKVAELAHTGPEKVEHWTSPDGEHWTWQGVAVDTSTSQLYRFSYVSHPTTIATDTALVVFFEACGISGGEGGKTPGMAWSTDGVHYSVRSAPVLGPGTYGAWDGPPGHTLFADYVVWQDSAYWMAYQGFGNGSFAWKMGYATSTDLIHWTRYPRMSGLDIYTYGPQIWLDRDGSLQCFKGGSQNMSGSGSQNYFGNIVLRDTTKWQYGSQWRLSNFNANHGLANSADGVIQLAAEAWVTGTRAMISVPAFSSDFEVMVRHKVLNGTVKQRSTLAIGSGAFSTVSPGAWNLPCLLSGYMFTIEGRGFVRRMAANGAQSQLATMLLLNRDLSDYAVEKLSFFWDAQHGRDSLIWTMADSAVYRASLDSTGYHANAKKIMLAESEFADSTGGVRYIDWVAVRKRVDREPALQIGTPEIHRFVRVVTPNGGEIWTIGVPAGIQWTGQGVSHPLRVSLNRTFPTGDWEILADSVVDPGPLTVEVSGLLAEHCRVRVEVIGDTLSDVSDADFSIRPDVRLLTPNGGEQWRIHETHAVQWMAIGWPGLMRLELNRSYPSGEWTLLADSLPNNGAAFADAGETVSDACRIRLSTLGADYQDMSDADFGITASQGYLALVRPNQPGVPIVNWDVGTVECPFTPTDTFLLRNLGQQDVTVYAVPLPADSVFSTRSSCGDYITLPPGQMSACDMVLTFGLPDHDGLFQDTLLIPTDAANQNGGFVRIPLSGHRVTTPPAPQVTIIIDGDDIRLHWPPVSHSVAGCTLPDVWYRVYAAPAWGGPFTIVANTGDSSYVDAGNADLPQSRVYMVRTVTSAMLQLSTHPQAPAVIAPQHLDNTE